MQVVIRIKDGFTLADVAAEINAIFGHGGDVDASKPELFLGMVNTPPVMGHVRIVLPGQCQTGQELTLPTGQTYDVVNYGTDPFIAGYVDGEPVYCGQIA